MFMETHSSPVSDIFEPSGAVLMALSVTLDGRQLHHAAQVVLGIHVADPARHGSELGERVPQGKSNQRVGVLVFFVRQVIVEKLVGALTVEIIGVNDGKGLVDNVTSHEYGMACSPGLGAFGRNAESVRDVVQLLEHVVDVGPVLELLSDRGAEGLLDVAANDKNDLAEANPQGVIDRVVDNNLAPRTHGVDLLEAAITAANTGGKDNK